MNIPCPNRINCPPQGNLDYDFPIANLTSERPDHEIFIGMAWGPLDSGGSQPPLGSVWSARGCVFVCQSIISQEDANNCAQQQAAFCTWGSWDPGHPPPGPGGAGSGPPGQQHSYGNRLAQCSAGCPDGSRFTWTILANQYFALTQDLADQIANSVACQKAQRFFFCLGTLNSGCASCAYNGVASITGNNPGPFSASLTAGALPPGLLLSQGPSSVVLSGTPTTAGTYSFTIQVQDSFGNFINKTFSLTIYTVTPNPLPAPTLNSPYSQQLALSGDASTTTWTLTGGTLPTGVTLSPSGLISGTPTALGSSSITIQVTDTSGTNCTATLTYSGCPGPDWTKMAWDVHTTIPGGTGFVNAASASVSASVKGDDAGGYTNLGYLHGSLSYTGAAATCKVTFSGVSVSPAAGHTSWEFEIKILQDGVPVLDNFYQTPSVIPASLTFNLIAGTNSVIEVLGGDSSGGLNNLCLGSAGIPGVPLLAGSINISFTLSNTC